jgi:hypothetical protein
VTTITVKKNEKPKVDSFKVWLEAKPYWDQYLWLLHIEKGVIEEADIDKCYQYLLEDSGVIKMASGRVSIVFPVLDLDGTDTPKAKNTLDKIENLKDINAIDDGCVLDFGKNLTIVYGDNGTGKSGIGRLLSNACLSRKPRQLLPNAHKASYPAPKATADFHVSYATGSEVIKYTFGQVHEALKSFSVFDHECALIHLNNENKVEFIPSKLKIFDDVFKSITTVEAKLQEEVKEKQQDNPTENIFTGVSPVTTFLESLSYKNTDKSIDDALNFSSTDKKLLAEKKKDVAKKLKQDVSTLKRLIQEDCNDLTTFKNTLATKSPVLSKVKANEINTLLKEIRNKKEIAEKLSVKNFDFAAFKNVGSIEWRSLIIAAQKLHEKETVSNDGNEPENCILCRQTLTNKEKTLFGEYWKFLNSTAESELASARRSIALSLDVLQRANTDWPTFSETEAAVKVLKKDAPADLKKIKSSFDGLKTQLIEWIGHVKKEEDVAYTDAEINLDPITTLIADKKKAESKLVDPTPAIRVLNGEIENLEQRQQASRLIPKIKKYVTWLRWEHSVESINLQTVRSNTTRKQTELMEELVISQYVDLFNKETKRLDCDFGLKAEPHGREGTTFKGLKLEFARGHSPSEILSDGEQRVSALADFLTEAKLDINNSGIIFDDPVNSLDHERRTTIAQRLVDEAKDRQVIIFTHDIIFLLDLQFYADSGSVEYVSLSMRKNGDRVGVVKKELPWFALNVKSRVGYLKNDLARLKKTETGDQDQYRKEVKGWYELVREAWERAVEERLFKGVVQRFSKGVQTQKLDRIDISPALIKEITDGMTESSKWVHDMAAGMNPAVPKNAKLEADIKLLEDFITKCKPD